jgi:hypothetical protein
MRSRCTQNLLTLHVVKEIYLESWEEFIRYFDDYDSKVRGSFIFRGHTNQSFYSGKFNRWSLVSSFNRSQPKNGYSFRDYLFQQIESELFRITYGNYAYKKIGLLRKSSALHKCYLFQHYGIPTCFIDFTFNPLIALYFSLANIPGRSGGTYDKEGNPSFYSNAKDRDFVSIYQVDANLLQNVMNVQHITSRTFGWRHLERYLISAFKKSNFTSYIGLDLKPSFGKNGLRKNYNLVNQEGCFLYYDNEESQISLEDFVQSYCNDHKVVIPSPIITIYNINYNSLFKKMHSRQPNHKSVFRYLKEKKLTGEYLFDDLQGLKYDFNFFHNE